MILTKIFLGDIKMFGKVTELIVYFYEKKDTYICKSWEQQIMLDGHMV